MNRRKIKRKFSYIKKSHRPKDRSDFYFTRDFSTVEDAPDSFEIIRDIAYRAGINAAKEAKVSGLPHTFVRNNQIIQVQQNGKEEIIETAESSALNTNTYYIPYSPATILHARKK